MQRKLDGLIDAIADGFQAPDLQQRLDDLQSRKADLTAKLEQPEQSLPAPLPDFAGLYRERVDDLASAFASSDDPAVLEAARALIDRVILTPSEDATGGFRIEIEGEIAAMLRLGSVDRKVAEDVSAKVVAGTGNHRELTLPVVLC